MFIDLFSSKHSSLSSGPEPLLHQLLAQSWEMVGCTLLVQPCGERHAGPIHTHKPLCPCPDRHAARKGRTTEVASATGTNLSSVPGREGTQDYP
jgi:hypothetical protein